MVVPGLYNWDKAHDDAFARAMEELKLDFVQ